MKSKVQDELKQHFRPEFLNRIDDIIVFHQLSKDEIVEIVDLMLARVDVQLKNKDMGLELTPAAKALLADEGLRPVARRPAAAAHDPAGAGGHPDGEDPVRRAHAGRDRGRRLRRRRRGANAHVPRRDQAAGVARQPSGGSRQVSAQLVRGESPSGRETVGWGSLLFSRGTG